MARETGVSFAVIGVALAVGMLAGCAQQEVSLDEPVGKAGWLAGDARTKFDTIAAHLGGFGGTMVEIGYRYEVLYWAGREHNWEFAAHQVEEIGEVLEHGLVRRPERRQSSESFVLTGIPAVQEAVARRDAMEFAERFETFRAQCNACHTMEKVQFIWVETPQQRSHAWGPLRPGT